MYSLSYGILGPYPACACYHPATRPRWTRGALVQTDRQANWKWMLLTYSQFCGFLSDSRAAIAAPAPTPLPDRASPPHPGSGGGHAGRSHTLGELHHEAHQWYVASAMCMCFIIISASPSRLLSCITMKVLQSCTRYVWCCHQA